MLGGTCMWPDPETGEETKALHELVRLAIPRRTYTQSHMDYVIEIIDAVWQKRASLTGTRITEAPPVLRHFSAHFEQIQQEAGV